MDWSPDATALNVCASQAGMSRHLSPTAQGATLVASKEQLLGKYEYVHMPGGLSTVKWGDGGGGELSTHEVLKNGKSQILKQPQHPPTHRGAAAPAHQYLPCTVEAGLELN